MNKERGGEATIVAIVICMENEIREPGSISGKICSLDVNSL